MMAAVVCHSIGFVQTSSGVDGGRTQRFSSNLSDAADDACRGKLCREPVNVILKTQARTIAVLGTWVRTSSGAMLRFPLTALDIPTNKVAGWEGRKKKKKSGRW
jgi:hypothetical protein